MCLAQGHTTVDVNLEPPTSRSGVRGSTSMSPRLKRIRLIATEKKVETLILDAQGQITT